MQKNILAVKCDTCLCYCFSGNVHFRLLFPQAKRFLFFDRAVSCSATCICTRACGTRRWWCSEKNASIYSTPYRQTNSAHLQLYPAQRLVKRGGRFAFIFSQGESRGSDLKWSAEVEEKAAFFFFFLWGGFVKGSWWSFLITSRPLTWMMLSSGSRCTLRAEAPCVSPATTCFSRTERRAALGRFYCSSGTSMPLRRGEGGALWQYSSSSCVEVKICFPKLTL